MTMAFMRLRLVKAEAAGDRSQDGRDALWLESHLRVRKAQRHKAGADVRLVAQPVPGLLGRRAVVAQAVRLDNELQSWPVEVHAEAVELHLGLWFREAHRASDGHK